MAIVDGNFLRGTVGGSVFKKHRNKQVVQGKSKKKQIDMTIASYDAAFVFGRASTFASTVRIANSNLTAFYDGGMISRFTGECNHILQQAAIKAGKKFNYGPEAFSRLNGFEFNTDSPVKNHLFAQPITSFEGNQVNIAVPEMYIPNDLKFPARAKYCILAFNVCLFDLENDLYKTQEIQSFEIELKHPPYTVPARQLSFNAAPGCLCIISLGLFYLEKTFAGNAVINNTSFSPSAILKADYCPGEIVPQPGWTKIDYNKKKKRKFKKAKPEEVG
jgi:hypothetical protein